MASSKPTAATLLNGLSLWGLPFFFLVSGLVERRHLATRAEPLAEWTVSRVKRLLVPYLGWSAIYVALPYLNSIRGHGGPPAYDWIAVIFTGGALGPLWFLPMLFYVSVAARAIGPRWRVFSLILAAIIAAAVFGALADGAATWGFWLLSPWYFFLFVGGSFIPDLARRSAPPNGPLVLTAFAILMTLTSAAALALPHSQLEPIYATTVTVVPAAAAAALLWSAANGWELGRTRALAKFAPLLLGVYLSHTGWLMLWSRFVRPETTPMAVWLPLTFAVVTVLAFTTSAAFRRIPVLRAIV